METKTKEEKEGGSIAEMRWCCLSHYFFSCLKVDLKVGGNTQLDPIDDETNKNFGGVEAHLRKMPKYFSQFSCRPCYKQYS